DGTAVPAARKRSRAETARPPRRTSRRSASTRYTASRRSSSRLPPERGVPKYPRLYRELASVASSTTTRSTDNSPGMRSGEAGPRDKGFDGGLGPEVPRNPFHGVYIEAYTMNDP